MYEKYANWLGLIYNIPHLTNIFLAFANLCIAHTREVFGAFKIRAVLRLCTTASQNN